MTTPTDQTLARIAEQLDEAVLMETGRSIGFIASARVTHKVIGPLLDRIAELEDQQSTLALALILSQIGEKPSDDIIELAGDVNSETVARSSLIDELRENVPRFNLHTGEVNTDG